MTTLHAQRIISQDFPEGVRSWINRLIIPLNQFMTSVSALLNHGLTFESHMNAEIKIIRVTSADRPTLSYRLKSKPIGLIVLRCHEELKFPISLDWVTTESGIKIRNIFGLEPLKTYTITLLILGR
jgi:hypothetical protein